MLDRVAIKTHAKKVLSEHYWTITGALLIVSAISGACGFIPGVGWLATVAVVPIVTIGCSYLAVLLYRGEKATIETMFDAFKNFGHNLGGYWWMMLFVWLWSLLLVIPGIVKSYAYCMTPFILMDQPEVDAQEALKKSMKMTEGHKAEIFVMHLSFIGWLILSAFTCGILALFYVAPYMALTMAGYYVVLRSQEVYGNGGNVYTQNPYQQPVQPPYQQPQYPQQPVQPPYQQPQYPQQPVQPQYQQPQYPQQPVQPQQPVDYQQDQPQNPVADYQPQQDSAAPVQPGNPEPVQNTDEDNPYMTPIE